MTAAGSNHSEGGSEDTLNRLTAEQKLNQALLRLGVSFADCAELVAYDPEAESAYWMRDRRTGTEAIHVGPTIARLDINCVEMALRHELLHRSMYNGFGEKYRDPQLSNLALDICINRLLYEAFPVAMRELSSNIYPEESLSTVVALANCSAGTSRLNDPKVIQLWHRIWDKTPDGEFQHITPASMYYRLLRLQRQGRMGNVPVEQIPFASPNEDGIPLDEPVPEEVGRAIRAADKDLNRHLPSGSGLGEELDEFSVSPVDIGTAAVERFIHRIRVRRRADENARKLREKFDHQTRVQFYPMFPTRIGITYQACGITDVFRMYWNRDTVNSGARMAVGIYMDVSGSMIDKYPVVSAYVEAMKDFALRLRVFDTEVRNTDVEALAKGNLEGGGGTDFEPPLCDMLEDEELVGAVLFTDGEADLAEETGRRLEQSGKHLYVVYLLSEEDDEIDSPLDHYATDSTSVIVSDEELMSLV